MWLLSILMVDWYLIRHWLERTGMWHGKYLRLTFFFFNLKKWLFWLQRRKHMWACNSQSPHDYYLSQHSISAIFTCPLSPSTSTISSWHEDFTDASTHLTPSVWHIVKRHEWKTNFPALKHGKQTVDMRTLEFNEKTLARDLALP